MAEELAPWLQSKSDAGPDIAPWIAQPSADSSWMNTAKDIGTGIIGGVARGAERFPGAMASMIGAAGKFAEPYLESAGIANPQAREQREQFLKDVGQPKFITDAMPHPETTAGKYAETIGEMVPAALASPGSLPRRLTMMAAVPGAASEAVGNLEGVKGTEYEPWARAGAAMVSPAIAEKAITPFPTRLNRAEAVNALRNEGVDVTAGQATGHDRLRYAESELGGSTARAFADRQGQQFTAAALRRIGENEANLATPDVMDRNFNRIGNTFDRVAGRHTLLPDQQLSQDLHRAIANYNRLTPPGQRSPSVDQWINDIADRLQVNGSMPGEVYGSYRSLLGADARAVKNDPNLQHVLYEIQGALDNNFARMLRTNHHTADLEALQNARREYRNIIVLERAVGAAGEGPAAGIITPQNLGNATKSLHGLRNYVRGQGDFADLAHAGREVMATMPQSGTSPRWWIHALTSGIGGLLGTAGGPAGSAAGLTAGFAVPRFLGEAMLSAPGRRYLGNSILPRDTNPYRSALTRGIFAYPTGTE